MKTNGRGERYVWDRGIKLIFLKNKNIWGQLNNDI